MFFVNFLPPPERDTALSDIPLWHPRESPRDGAPGLRFAWTQQVRVVRFCAGFIPFFSLDKRERLMCQPTRLPGLDCSANRRCSEVRCRSECCEYQERQQETTPASASLQPHRPRRAHPLCEDQSRTPEAVSRQPPRLSRTHSRCEDQSRTPEAMSRQPSGPRRALCPCEESRQPEAESRQPPGPRQAHYLYALINRDDRPTPSPALFS